MLSGARAVILAACAGMAGAAESGDVTACVANRALAQTLRSVGASPADAADAVSALKPGAAVAVIDATASNLAALADHPQEVAAFTGAGGWILLNGLDADGLAAYDRLVGVAHLLRPFRHDRIDLIAARDPLLAGVRRDDVEMRDQGPDRWVPEVVVSPDAYGPLVDVDANVAPFAAIPEAAWFKHPDALIDHDPANLVDGFTSAQAGWKKSFALYPDRSRLDWTFTLPRAEDLATLEWTSSSVYSGITRVEVTFDGDQAAALSFAPDEGGQIKRLELSPPRHATTIGFRIAEFTPGAKTLGVDEIRLLARRADAFAESFHALTTGGGALVAYPRGDGGILLCQLHYSEREQDPRNLPRKQRVLKALLTNLHAALGEPGSYTPPPPAADARGVPIDLGAAADRVIGSDGWLVDPAHSFHLAGGDHLLCGVRFLIAAPDAPKALVLTGGRTSASFAVGREAPMLCFLQAAVVPPPSTPPAPGAPPRLIAHYQITWEDGRTARVPLEDAHDLADGDQAAARDLDRAQLARLAAGHDGRFVALYIRQWDNPTPQVPVAKVDVALDDPAAAVAVLACTAVADLHVGVK
jgi:hypothetical protein